MKPSTKAKISRIFVVSMLLVMAILVKLERDKTKEMITRTSGIINTLSAGAYVQAQNAELLIKVFSRLNGVDFGGESKDVLIGEPFEPPIKDANISGGSRQVMSDLDDIQKFSGSLAMNNIFQRDSIKTILKALSEMDDIEVTLEDKMFTQSDILYGEEEKVIPDSNIDTFEWDYVDNKKQEDD